MTWTYVSSKSVKTDYFQDEVGTKESCSEEGKEPRIKVLRGYTYRYRWIDVCFSPADNRSRRPAEHFVCEAKA